MFTRRWIFSLFIVAIFSIGLIAEDAFSRGGSGGGGGRSGGGGGRSFSSGGGGSRSSGGGSRSSGGSSGGSRSFSGGGGGGSKSSGGGGGGGWFGGGGSKPKVDAGAQRAQRMEQSRQRFQGYRTTPGHARNVGRRVTPQHLNTRQQRQTVVYNTYVNRTPAYYPVAVQPIFGGGMYGYRDPFGNMFFWMWLMDRNQHERDTWLYHHRSEIDPARYKALQANDAELEARLRRLEQQGLAKDSDYTPSGLKDNPDLMYGEDFVRNAHEEANQKEEEDSGGFPWGGFFITILVIGVIVGLIWVIGFRRAY